MDAVFFQTFSQIPIFRDRVQYADSFFPCIGVGSGRKVYDLGNGQVLKLAVNRRGISQNATEIRVYVQSENKNILTKIFHHNISHWWLVCEKATALTEADFHELTGLQLAGFLYNLRFHRNGAIQHPLFDAAITLLKCFNLDRFDISDESAWGVVDNRPVLVDYGLTLDDAQRLYHVHYAH